MVNKEKLIFNNVLELVGNTPLVRLNVVTSEFPGSYIAKLDSFNPGHSSKDRIALHIIEEAEKKGILKNMIEKPKKNYVVNTGFYICKPSMLKHLPKNKINFGMDLVIKNLLSKKKKIFSSQFRF